MALVKGNEVQVKDKAITKKRDTDINEVEMTDASRKLLKQFDDFHKKTFYPVDVDIETEFYTNILSNILDPVEKMELPLGTPVFSPSSADKCERELYYRCKAGVSEDSLPNIPYQKRWTRNSTLVHEGVQKDLLYMETHLPKADFTITRDRDGFPQWEENIKTTKLFIHEGQEFAITGMMDGILKQKSTGKEYGFEFKTKSNSIAQVGTYKLKEPSSSHIQQCIGYSLLFELEDFLIMYEAVAKDGWMKGHDARFDLRVFEQTITETDRQQLLDKFARVSNFIQHNVLPKKETDKCLFCEYKDECSKEMI